MILLSTVLTKIIQLQPIVIIFNVSAIILTSQFDTITNNIRIFTTDRSTEYRDILLQQTKSK